MCIRIVGCIYFSIFSVPSFFFLLWLRRAVILNFYIPPPTHRLEKRERTTTTRKKGEQSSWQRRRSKKITLKIPKWNDWPLPDIFSAFPVKWAACHSRTISGPPSSSSIVALGCLTESKKKRHAHQSALCRHSSVDWFRQFSDGGPFLLTFFVFFVFSLLSPVLLVSVFKKRKKKSAASQTANHCRVWWLGEPFQCQCNS